MFNGWSEVKKKRELNKDTLRRRGVGEEGVEG